MKETGTWALKELSRQHTGRVNDVCVCERTGGACKGRRFIRLSIRDHDIARRLLAMTTAGTGALRGELEVTCIGEENALSFLFPYRTPRPLNEFYKSVPDLRRTAARFMMECMASPLPWPLLYLTLEQGCVHIDTAGDVYFTYDWDLEAMDEGISERDCAGLAAGLVLKLLGEGQENTRRRELIRRKRARNAYASLSGLYRDITLDLVGRGKSRKEKIRDFFIRHKNGIYRLLLIAGITLALLGGSMLLSQLIFGDFIGFRLFSHPFDYIGTETLR